jgi:RimJ/RimL family protein N-acetyltransferase
MRVAPVTLAGEHVRLEPLSIHHAGPLARVGLDPELWRLQPAPIETEEDMRRYVASALDDEQRGVSLPFAILDWTTRQVIGSTRYMEITPQHRRLEIGATWFTPSFQRTGANTETKLLMLTHAFETMGAIRVVFKTEVLNQKSRAALQRIGAVEEGTFRQHLIADSGRRRDMVYFAIIEDEWLDVKARLVNMLEARAGRPQTSSGDAASMSESEPTSSGRR